MPVLLKFLPPLLALSLVLPLSAKEILLPTETSTYKNGPGVELAKTYCLTCHSTEYVSIQPPFPRKYWETIVKKMTEKFGAPSPGEQLAPLVNYLTTFYGEPQK